MKKITITKKLIRLSKDVLEGKRLYWSSGSIENDIEKAIKEQMIEELESGYDNYDFNIYAVENRLRESGYRIHGDK
jgi:hypothetical protein